MEDRNTWLRIIDFFSSRQEYLKASFFLVEAQEKLDTEGLMQDDIIHLVQQLESNLALPPGIVTLDSDLNEVSSERPTEEAEMDSRVPVESIVQPEPHKPSLMTTEAFDVWERALECFKEGTEGNNLIYLQAFIHYAHSTVRELLRLDGNFKTGLERQVAEFGLFQVAEFGLFDHKQFFVKLNRLRNAVIHDNYAVSEEEAVGIHSKLSDLINLYTKND
ncbi:MAG: hypothetical protein ACXACU_19785 [Candidatus Hodarchaeales archaeon]